MISELRVFYKKTLGGELRNRMFFVVRSEWAKHPRRKLFWVKFVGDNSKEEQFSSTFLRFFSQPV